MALYLREDLERFEEETLRPYACRSSRTRGREAGESPDRLRTEFQRDRDRILHCSAFRKLEYKTQVYVTHEGDNFRTRLTHTLEAAQIARTLARNLGLNGDLTEAIALAHDLGHTPFGHTGEAVLSELLAEEGGFEHNAQSLRLVEVLEERFHNRPGLNLTWEVREGIAHHSSSLQPEVNRYKDGHPPSLEAQIVDLADAIAYNHHDLDDALSIRLITMDQLREVAWLWEIIEHARERLPEDASPYHLKNRILGVLMDRMVHDLLEATSGAIEANGIDSPEAVHQHSGRLAGFSPTMVKWQEQLRSFLFANVYRHPRTLRMQNKAARFFRSLFLLYRDQPEVLPLDLQAKISQWGLPRVLADYLSGMTDRYCLEEYRHHFDPSEVA